jgi:hypothetical protein
MLNKIMAERQAAGWKNPAQGLEQFRNVAASGSFSGAHREGNVMAHILLFSARGASEGAEGSDSWRSKCRI